MHGTPGVWVNENKLMEDYELANIKIDAKIAELRLATEEEMTEAQHKKHTRLVSEFNDNFLNSFRNLCVSIREVLPERAVELKAKHEGVFKEKIPIIEMILGDLRKKMPEKGLGHGGRVLRGPRAGGAADEQQEVCSLPLHKHTIKLKPLEAPIFDRTARSYARFKREQDKTSSGQKFERRKS